MQKEVERKFYYSDEQRCLRAVNEPFARQEDPVSSHFQQFNLKKSNNLKKSKKLSLRNC